MAKKTIKKKPAKVRKPLPSEDLKKVGGGYWQNLVSKDKAGYAK